MNINDEDDIDPTDGLTDAEREALQGDDDADEGDEDEGGDDGDAEAGQEAKEAEAQEADAGGEDDGGDGEEAAADPDVPLRAVAPADAKEKLAALDADEVALQEKFDDGEITSKEFREGLRSIDKGRRDIEWQLRKAELAAEAEEKVWFRDVGEFMNTTAKALKGKEALLTAFDLHVRKVTGDPENAKLSNRAMLAKAYKAFTDELGAAGASAPGAKSDPAPAGNNPKPKPAGGKKEIVPTLARVPAAEVEDTGDGGKFGILDRLADKDPDAFEKAFERLTPAEQEAYLRDA